MLINCNFYLAICYLSNHIMSDKLVSYENIKYYRVSNLPYLLNFISMEEKITKEEYNAIPVVYCTHCLSLKVMTLDEDTDYCDKCGSTDTATTDINTWLKMYEEKYGKPYLNLNKK